MLNALSSLFLVSNNRNLCRANFNYKRSKVFWRFTNIWGAVGTTPYTSKFTQEIEQLPAAVGFIAAKGSDIMLADFVSKLSEDSYTIIESEQEQAPLG